MPLQCSPKRFLGPGYPKQGLLTLEALFSLLLGVGELPVLKLALCPSRVPAIPTAGKLQHYRRPSPLPSPPHSLLSGLHPSSSLLDPSPHAMPTSLVQATSSLSILLGLPTSSPALSTFLL